MNKTAGISLLCMILFITVLSLSGTSYAQVDFTTLSNKVMVGYQGWHWCNRDGSPYNDWNHWSSDGNKPDPSNCHMDMYPDMTEYSTTYRTNYKTPGGASLKVYSAADYSTVDLHFKWMHDYNIDGAFIQRFISNFKSYAKRAQTIDLVLSHCETAAETYGRTFVVMYDVSNSWDNDAQLYDTITYDWNNRASSCTNSANYLHHKGKPLVVVWGMGKEDRWPVSPAVAQDIIDFFKADGCTVMGGVDNDWRTLGGGCRTNTDGTNTWTSVYNSFDVISPWFVGSITGLDGADQLKTSYLIPDLANCNSRGVDYMPVAFPGFSWSNWKDGYTDRFNDKPRLGGKFLWQQAYNVKSTGINMLYLAMFDEVDEGTALYKTTPTAETSPKVIFESTYTNQWVSLDIDGYIQPNGDPLPSDWYLQVCDEINKMYKGETTATSQLPLLPNGYPPVVTISGAPPGNESGDPFTISLSVSNNYGYYSLDGSPWGRIDTTNSPIDVYISANTTLRYYGENQYGTGSIETINYIVDTVPPNILITSGPTNDISFSIPFNVTLETDEPWGYWSKNGSPYTQFSPSATISISNTTVLTYYAEDSYGHNSGTNTVTYTRTIVSYDTWADSFGVQIGDPYNDYDGDGKNNLYEYAFGGNPRDMWDTGTKPTFVLNEAAHGFLYQHVKRKDDLSLVYSMTGCADPATDTWTTNGINYLATLPGTEFDTVYYVIPTNQPRHIIQLKILMP